MVRSSKSVKRTEMSTRRDNVTIDPPPYYFRHRVRDLAKSQEDHVTSKQNADSKRSISTTSKAPKKKSKYCTYYIHGMLGICIMCFVMTMLFPYPLHASCIVKWKFDDPCTYVMQKFRCQIMNWSSWNVCRQREGNCLYTLKVPAEENVIQATHRMSNLKSLEKIKIVFEERNNTCFATGDSVSSGWFTVFDYGANYCNLRNLVVGAGLDRHMKFLELTSDAVCTQFDMAVCG
ncbi:uncharacterized protein [Linepithema humile]|uniref:uncharacterized protein n=1 Tax=Linepithema humile TaxID=83485 RepID=UPI000623A08D|nr:PREDICTED: uncharacterized protein LOC105671391 [Linepithema humile]